MSHDAPHSLQGIWLDQADALMIKEGEEVTLMDWGNCFLSVCVGCMDVCCLHV